MNLASARISTIQTLGASLKCERCGKPERLLYCVGDYIGPNTPVGHVYELCADCILDAVRSKATTEAAHERRAETMVLSERDSKAFLDALANPPEPNDALVRVAREYEQKRRTDTEEANDATE